MAEKLERGYDEGYRDGQIIALERMQEHQNARLDKHEARLASLERVAYIVIGSIALMQFLPAVQEFLGK